MTGKHEYLCACGARLRYREDQVGRRLRCRRCGRRFVLETSLDRAQDAGITASPSIRADAGSSKHVKWGAGTILLGHFEVRRLAGKGGMGSVYEVFHRDWQIPLAMKVPAPKFFTDVKTCIQFERECQTWLKLGLHTHIVTCHFVRRLEMVPLIFSEFVSGGTFDEAIRRGRLYQGSTADATKRILDIAIQVAWALRFAHQLGVVHQDVKPANFLLTCAGTAKLSDFGISKAQENLPAIPRTTANPRVSTGGMTLAYCSPEQYRNERLGPPSDVWSWAVSVLEAFTGGVVWTSGQAAAESLRVVEDVQQQAKSKLPAVPAGLNSLLEECFSPSPENRPDFKQAVERLAETYFEISGDFYPREEPQHELNRGDLLAAANLNNKAISSLELNKTEDAFEALSDALLIAEGADEGITPSALVQDIAYNRALAQIRTNRLFDASAVQSLVPMKPDEKRHALFSGALMLTGGEFVRGVRVLENCLNSKEHQSSAFKIRGVGLLLNGEKRPAIQSFKRALALMPGQFDVARNLAMAYFLDGRPAPALYVLRRLHTNGVFSADDQVIHGAVLSAAGMRRRARRELREATEGLNLTAEGYLTAVESGLGMQNFLPALTPAAGSIAPPQALIDEAIRLSNQNLRAATDKRTAPSRYALKPHVKTRWKRRLVEDEEDPVSFASQIVASHEARDEHRVWGELHPGSERVKCLAVAAIAPLFAAYWLWLPLLNKYRLEEAFGHASPRLQLALWVVMSAAIIGLVLRVVPRARVVQDGLLYGLLLPAVVYLPTTVHVWYMDTVLNVPGQTLPSGHLAYFRSFAWGFAVIFLSRELPYRYFCARVRAYESFSALFRRPRWTSGMLTLGSHPVSSPWIGSIRSLADLAYTYSTVAAMRFLTIPQRIGPVIVRTIRNLRSQFGLWQAFLAPQFFVLALADTALLWETSPPRAAPYFAAMLSAHTVLLLFTAFIPRLFLTCNFAVAAIVSTHVASALSGDNVWGVGVIAMLVWSALAGLNYLAIQHCPAFAPKWRGRVTDRWDILTILDPLNLRRGAAPWRIIESEAATKKDAIL